MNSLSNEYELVALELKGFRLGDLPYSTPEFFMDEYINELDFLVEYLRVRRAVIIGHDIGGAIGWSASNQQKNWLKGFISVNMPHPSCFLRELSSNVKQQELSQYAVDYATKSPTPIDSDIFNWIDNPTDLERYLNVFKHLKPENLIGFYKANFPLPPFNSNQLVWGKIINPVLHIYGANDPAFTAECLNGTEQFFTEDLYKLIIYQNCDHYPHKRDTKKFESDVRNWLHNTIGYR